MCNYYQVVPLYRSVHVRELVIFPILQERRQVKGGNKLAVGIVYMKSHRTLVSKLTWALFLCTTVSVHVKPNML